MCQNYLLNSILEEIWSLKSNFAYISVCHIYREQNKVADLLYNEGVQQTLGSWKIKDIGSEGLVERDCAPFS